MSFVRACLLLVLAIFPMVGGCTQRLAVEGRSDRLYAEAEGALESEGFRPVGRGAEIGGATGSDARAGRLQFAYYGDAMAPTIVEVQIEPGPHGSVRPVGATSAGAVRDAKEGKGEPAAPAGEPAVATGPAFSPGMVGAHRVVIRAWSSLTYAPDPFIADLAMGVLRRAYLLSGNVR
jgi:hypothetical protein